MDGTENDQGAKGDQLTEDLIIIDDPEVDPAVLMAQIRVRIERRRQELGYESRHFPTFGAAARLPEPPEDLPYDPDLYHHLRQANELYTNPETGAVLAPSPATQLPVVGRFWKLIRSQVHGLVLFYVNRSVAHQVSVNRHLVSVLNQLVTDVTELNREVQQLRQEVKALRERSE